MPQLTLYLDAQTEERLKAAAQAAGVSLSRWVGDLVRAHTASEWPEGIRALAGAWADVPIAETLRKPTAADVPREEM